MFIVATATIIVLFVFVAWPLIRARLDPQTDGVPTGSDAAATDAALAAVEEVELDVASGRLGSEEGARRLSEVRARAQEALLAAEDSRRR